MGSLGQFGAAFSACVLLTSCAGESPPTTATPDDGSTSAIVTAPGAPEKSPSSRAAAGSAACDEEALRAATSDGTAPLIGRTFGNRYSYDTFEIHACSGRFALVEASNSSASTFDYWLMTANSQRWEIVDAAAVRTDTPIEEGLFDCNALKGTGVPMDSVLDALGAQVPGNGRELCL